MMEAAKKQIEERKKILNVDEDRVSAITALQARIAATMGNLGAKGIVQLTPEQIQNAQAAEERDRSLNLLIDAEGRTIDKRTGEIVQIQSRLPTLKANIRSKKKEVKILGVKPSEVKVEKEPEVQPLPFKFTKSGTTSIQEPSKPVEEAAAYFDNRLK